MATWSFIEYMDATNYNPWYHAAWSQYSVVLLAGDTLSVRTIYNGGNSAATSVNYIASPNSSTTVNDPDPTTSDTGLDRTWSTSSFSNSNHHSRWFWFTASVPTGTVVAQASIRILTIPTTMGWSGVQANIEQNTSGSAVLAIPSSFEPYIQGTASETGDNGISTNGSYDERFYWIITSSSTSHTPASGFASSSGTFSGPSNGDSITISPSTSVTAGTYYAKLYFYDYNGNTGTSDTLIDTVSFTVSAAAPLDTTISLNSTSITTYDTDTYYTQSLTGGGSNTIYYIFNASNIANGSNLESLRTGGDSRYIARTFSTAASRPFSTGGVTTQITNDLPSSSNTSKTYYVYATNLNGQNSVKLTNTYTVTLTAVAPTLSASKQIITNGYGMYSNPSGTTSGTLTYQWTTTGGGSGPNQNTNASYGWNSPAANLGQNAAVGTEWSGTTWSVQARATVDGGSTYVYSSSSSVTLPEYTFTAAPTSIEEGQPGSFTVTSTNGLGPIYWQATPSSQFPTNGDSGQITNYSTSTNQGSFSVTPLSDSITETGGTTATIKLYINNTFDTFNYIYAQDTFTITDPVTPTAPVVSNTQTFAGTESATTTCTIALTSSGANGTLEYNVTTDTTVPTQNWNTSATVSVTRGTTYYFWARRGAGYEDRTDNAITVPYLSFTDNTITLSAPEDKNSNTLTYDSTNSRWEIPSSYGTTSADTIDVPYTDGGSNHQYRMVSNDAATFFVSLGNALGPTSSFTLEPSNDLPTAGSTFTYSFEGRRAEAQGGDGVWQSVTATPPSGTSSTFKIFRDSAGVTYSVSASPTSINEGQSVTFTVTTTGLTSTVTVGYTISGIVAADLSAGNLTGTITIANNTGSTSITLDNDTLTEGSETATFTLATTDSANNSTGQPNVSVTIADTSTQPGGGSSATLPGGTANPYGLAIKNQAGTQTIIDDTSRIGSSLASGSITLTNSNTSGTLFSGFNCNSVATTGFIVKWTGAAWTTPTITRSTNGITVTRTGAANGTITVYLIRY